MLHSAIIKEEVFQSLHFSQREGEKQKAVWGKLIHWEIPQLLFTNAFNIGNWTVNLENLIFSKWGKSENSVKEGKFDFCH